MNRYHKTFSAVRARREAAFIPFTVAGDPDISTSETILKTYIDNGADILEIGYPFSDPIADGPVNQRGALRAIAAGIDHASFFKLIKNVRAYAGDIPIGILLYANTVLFPGFRAFCTSAGAAGIDSLLVDDMPPEEYAELGAEMINAGLSRVFIASELTPADRMRMICESVDAFVYVVSRLGITGTATTLSGSILATIAKLKKVTDKPLAVGFGISTPEHVREVVAAGADGAIVGSALVKLVETHLNDTRALVSVIGSTIRSFKAATVKSDKQ